MHYRVCFEITNSGRRTFLYVLDDLQNYICHVAKSFYKPEKLPAPKVTELTGPKLKLEEREHQFTDIVCIIIRTSM